MKPDNENFNEHYTHERKFDNWGGNENRELPITVATDASVPSNRLPEIEVMQIGWSFAGQSERDDNNDLSSSREQFFVLGRQPF